MTRNVLRRAAAAVAAVVATAAAALLVQPAAGAATTLIGTFELTSGSCAGNAPTGTYLRMILPSGSPSGPFMSNSDSSCHDQSVTPLAAGTDGGLVAGTYQSPPSPVFDGAGNAQARRITAPAQFYGTAFATGTTSVDAQTRTAVPAPRVTANGSHLSADLRAFSVTWNNQYFNQGAPKPDGSYPGNTRSATGTYNAATGAFTLQWTSQVVGGPFDKFTGLWHLAGRFVPAGGTGATSTNTHVGAANAGSPATAGAATRGTVAPNAAPGALPNRPSGSTSNAAAVPVAANGGEGGAVLAASTRTVINHGWRAQWWLVVLAVVIAVAGFGALFVVNRSIRRSASA